MIYLRRYSFQTRQGGKGRRGSVIVLVVAVLALLAVIGTVYIVSSRAERGSASASNTAVNLDLAQKAVDDLVIQVIGDAVLDARGDVGGNAGAGNKQLLNGVQFFGIHQARRYDIPEINILALPNMNTTEPTLGPFSAFHNQAMRDQAWLVDGIYRPKENLNDTSLPGPVFDPFAGVYPSGNFTADGRYNSLSILTPALFNPASGTYNIHYYSSAGRSFTPANMFSVVADPSRRPPVVPTTYLNGNPSYVSSDADAYIQLLPFSEASGVRYRFGVRIVDTSSMANLNVGMTVGSLSSDSNNYGTYFNSYALDAAPSFPNAGQEQVIPPNNIVWWGVKGLSQDVSDNIFGLAGNFGNAGRLGQWSAPATPEYAAQLAAMTFEAPTYAWAPLGTVIRTAPFGIADELELRSYGVLGTYSTPRAAIGTNGLPVWPNTLGNRDQTSNATNPILEHNFARGNYTTYSYSRQLRTVPDFVDSGTKRPTAYTLTPSGGGPLANRPPNNLPNPPEVYGLNHVFPLYPAPVAANPDVNRSAGFSLDQAAQRLAAAATNIASLMEKTPGAFTREEACAFAANYLTYTWNNWKNNVAGTRGWSMPLGPSFVDDTGICLRAKDVSNDDDFSADFGVPGPANTDLRAETAGKLYLGYAAQPFLNEVAVTVRTTQDSMMVYHEELTDWAVELYNPYNVDLSLNGYVLNIAGTNLTFPVNAYVPARSYFVVCKSMGDFEAQVDMVPGAQKYAVSDSLGQTGDVQLRRPYRNRQGNDVTATVDRYDISNLKPLYDDLMVGSAISAAESYCVQRRNGDTAPGNSTLRDRWQVVFETTDMKTLQSSASITIAKDNANSDGSLAQLAVPLYDRMLTDDGYVDLQREVLKNVADFNRIMRVTHQIDAGGEPLVGSGTLAEQLENRRTALAVTGTEFPFDAAIHFDFRSHPSIYGGAATTQVKPGDPRAATLLESLAFTDRVSEFLLNLGDNNEFDRGLSKLRIPGKINVNTASAEVLATLPYFNANPDMIGVIMAYRWRTTTVDPRIPTWAQPVGLVEFNKLDGSNNPHFPGYGIRSIGELEVPISYALKVAGAAPKTLDERDVGWARIANTLTVRSDTFVVYAYLEAVKQNPRYNDTPFRHFDGSVDNSFNNGTDWYLNTKGANGGITDDANDPTAPLLRVARRRWVEIVDRSESNYSRIRTVPQMTGNPVPYDMLDARFKQPRIVGARELPR